MSQKAYIESQKHTFIEENEFECISRCALMYTESREWPLPLVLLCSACRQAVRWLDWRSFFNLHQRLRRLRVLSKWHAAACWQDVIQNPCSTAAAKTCPVAASRTAHIYSCKVLDKAD